MEVHQFGKHTLDVPLAGVCKIVFHGDLEGDEMLAVVQKMRELFERAPFVFVIAEFTNVGSISASSRKVAGEQLAMVPMRGVAVHGANFQTRIICKLVLGAIALVSKNPTPTVFVDTEGEAFAWVQEQLKTLTH